MKVGLLLDDSLDFPDGVQQYTKTIGAWLSSKGHSVQYIASQTNDPELVVSSLTKNIKVSFNGNIVRTPLPISQKKADTYARQHALDVLHVQMPYSPLFAGKIIKAYKKEGTRIVGTFHIAPFSWLDPYAAKIQYLSIRSTLNLFDGACSVSIAAQQFAKDIFYIDTSVIPNAVQLDKFYHPKTSKVHASKNISITFLGRLVKRKGCYWLLRAVSRLVEEHPELRSTLTLRIGGRGPLERVLKDTATELGLDSMIVFDGFIEEDQKATYLSDSDICVFPSLGGESFGIILVEAAATHSCIVLAGNNPGYVGVLSKAPNQIFDPKDTTAFSNILWEHIQLTKDSNEKTRILALQSTIAKQFDVKHVGKQLLELYKN